MAHPFEARPDREAEATQLLQEVWDSERDSDGDLCIYLFVKPNSRIDAAICSTCSCECVRAFRR